MGREHLELAILGLVGVGGEDHHLGGGQRGVHLANHRGQYGEAVLAGEVALPQEAVLHVDHHQRLHSCSLRRLLPRTRMLRMPSGTQEARDAMVAGLPARRARVRNFEAVARRPVAIEPTLPCASP